MDDRKKKMLMIGGVVALVVVVTIVAAVMIDHKKKVEQSPMIVHTTTGAIIVPANTPVSTLPRTFIVGAKYLIQNVASGAYISLQNNVKGQVAVTVPDVNSATAFTYQAENSFTPPFITYDQLGYPANNAVPFTTSLDKNLIYVATRDQAFANALQTNNSYKQVIYGYRTNAANRDLTFRNVLDTNAKEYEVRFIKV